VDKGDTQFAAGEHNLLALAWPPTRPGRRRLAETWAAAFDVEGSQTFSDYTGKRSEQVETLGVRACPRASQCRL